MIAIITGDIINSRKHKPEKWLSCLKEILNIYGQAPKHWQIYRGDSFQLEVKPEASLNACFLIKASIKQFKNIDVRLAIGIGDKNFESEKITESNGSAFINSGGCFESLKKSTLAIKSPFKAFDNQINIMLSLAQLTINNWTSTSALLMKNKLKNPNLNQQQLAEI